MGQPVRAALTYLFTITTFPLKLLAVMVALPSPNVPRSWRAARRCVDTAPVPCSGSAEFTEPLKVSASSVNPIVSSSASRTLPA